MSFSRYTLTTVMISLVVVNSMATALVSDSRRMVDSEWGARGIRVVLENDAGKVEFDCAHGTIKGPLKIDSKGRFNLEGTFVRERGGPVRIGESNKGEPAEYSGWTDGKKMTLKVKLKGSKELLGTYSLVRGQEGRLFKCL